MTHCVCTSQVLQNQNTVTVEKVLLCNGKSGHITDTPPVVSRQNQR